MAVLNNQVANQNTFNGAFMSRTAASTSTAAIVQLLNTALASGASVNNVQALLNKIMQASGISSESDTLFNDYASNRYVADNTSRKVAIEVLDTQLFNTNTNLAVAQAAITSINSQITTINSSLTTISGQITTINTLASTFGGDKTFTGVVTFNSDIYVLGTTYSRNQLEVTDTNVTVNKGGTNASSEGAGLTVDRVGTKGSFIYANAATSKFKCGDLGAEIEIVTISGTQTLSGKTLTAPTITGGTLTSSTLVTPTTDIVTFAEQGSTPLAPAAGFRKLYPKADGFYQRDSTGLETKVGTGSGSGGDINYLSTVTDGDVTTGFVISKNTVAGAIPDLGFVVGSTNITLAVSATSPLRGTNSLDFTKDAANRQGQQAYIPFTIDPADRGKALRFTVDYSIFSGTYADDDVIGYVLDVTNNKLIEPVPFKIKRHTLPSDRFFFEFQASIDSVSYRLIFHVASTSALAYVIKFDALKLSPNIRNSVASNNTDWLAYIPTFTGLGTVTLAEAFWRRVGDSIQIRGRGVLGTTTGVTAKISFPSPYIVDPSKTVIQTIYGGELVNQNTGLQSPILATPSDTGILFGTAANPLSSSVGTVIGTSGNTFGWDSGLIPIAGWSSGSQIIDDGFNNRIVDFLGAGTGATQALTANVTDIQFTMVKDSANAWTGSAYRMPAAGDLVVSAFLYSTLQFAVMLYINGVSFNKYLLASPANLGGGGSLLLPNLKAGDLVSLRTPQTGITIPADTAQNLSIVRVSSSSQILASDKIFAKYSNVAGTSIPNNASTKMVFPTKKYDTTAAFDTVNNRVILSKSQNINLSGLITFTGMTGGTGVIFTELFKNGSFVERGQQILIAHANPSCTFNFDDVGITGDYYEVNVIQANGAARSLESAVTSNYLIIKGS